MNCNGCDSGCRQGRDCLGSFNATRAVLGLPPLHRDVSDEPVYTASGTSSLVYASIVVSVLVIGWGLSGIFF